MAGLFHVHSMYSINDSGSTVKDICNKAIELGYTSVTLTDHGSLLGILPFVEMGEKLGINAIPGIEAYLENGEHLCIVAKDYEGFRAISYANTEANKHINKHPTMSNEILERFFKDNEHVIASTACIGGPIGRTLLLEKRWKDHKEKKIKPYNTILNAYNETNKNYLYYKEQERIIKEQKKGLTPYVSTAYKNTTERVNGKLTDEERKDRRQKTKDAEESISCLNKQLTKAAEFRKQYKKEFDKLRNKKKNLESMLVKIEENKPVDNLYEIAKNRLQYLNSIFPNFYSELQYHGMEEEKIVMTQLVEMSNELGIPFIVGNDAHTINKGDETLRNILRFNMFKKHVTIEDVDKHLYMMSKDELSKRLKEIIRPDIVDKAIDNLNILDECKVVFPKEKHYPSVKDGPCFDELLEEEKQNMIKTGVWNDIYENRLKHEVEVIKSMGFVDYHMVVRDFCFMGKKLGLIPADALSEMPLDFSKIDNWLEKRGYKVGVGIGPGRGSAAGSLVCYMLHITNIDPIKYNLLFERFLNPERVTMPDIDTDVSQNLRPYLIKYLQWRYGESAICSIATETTYGAKNAISLAGRDRASELYDNIKKSEEEKHQYMIMVNEISSLVGDEVGVTLSDIEERVLSKYQNNAEALHVFNNAKLIEGKISGTGIHAGGVVISDNDNINDYIHIAWNEKREVWAAQCDMNRLEENGLIKMDLLGLQTLDIISNCLQLVLQHTGECITEFPFEEEVFREIFAKGNTNCVFQFESNGMKNLLKQFKPTCFEDLILLNACYRPGPLQYIDGSNEINLIKRKNKEQKITYLVPELEPILKDTYGGIVYQESVMQIFKDLAGYSLGGADMVRRAMSKKKTKVLAKERQTFVYGDKERNIVGCINNGIPEDKANKLFDDMTEFARYAFNKSHSTAYAYVAYQTAWLKYHYPVEFLCSMFNQKEINDYEPIFDDCNTYHIKILPPDINHSFYDFTIDNHCINYGFKGIKGIASKELINSIIYNRENSESGYDCLSNFMLANSTDTKFQIDKGAMDSFILSGCFQKILPNRKQTYEVYSYYKTLFNNKNTIENIIQQINDYRKTFIKMDKDPLYNYKYDIYYMGSILGDNPLEKYQDDSYYNCTKIDELTDNTKACVMGYILNIEKGVTNKGKDRILLEVQGNNGKLKVYIMNQQYLKYNRLINSMLNKVVKIQGEYKFNILFAEDISLLDKDMGTYFYVCDTVEKYKKLNYLFNNRKGKDAILFIENYISANLQISKTPYVVATYVSLDTIKIIQAINEKNMGVN